MKHFKFILTLLALFFALSFSGSGCNGNNDKPVVVVESEFNNGYAVTKTDKLTIIVTIGQSKIHFKVPSSSAL